MIHFLKFLILSLIFTSCKSLTANIPVATIEIKYEAHTRGFFLELIAKNKALEHFDHFERLKSTTKILNARQWNELMSLVNEIEQKKISKVEAPSNLRHTDAAAFARLTLIFEKDTFSSKYFDHKNPPKLIRPIVEKILSLQ